MYFVTKLFNDIVYVVFWQILRVGILDDLSNETWGFISRDSLILKCLGLDESIQNSR
jgi:hypothetical protein